MNRKTRSLALALVVLAAVPITASEERLSESVPPGIRSFSLSGLVDSLFRFLFCEIKTSGNVTNNGNAANEEGIGSSVGDGRGTLDPDG
jgi:hypothetical protein